MRFADQFRLELRCDHHIGDHAAGGEKSGDDAGQEELADRQFGQHAPDDHQDRWRYQHAKAGAAGDAAECKIAAVAEAPHFRIGDARECGGGGDADAGDESEQRIRYDGCSCKPAGEPPAGAVAKCIEIARGAAFCQEVAHQHEQWDHGKHVIAQRLIGGIGYKGPHDLQIAGH